jgi:hypothetical protein
MIVTDNESAAAQKQHRTFFTPLTGRAVLLGLAICPLLVYWAEYTEIVACGADLIAMSLIMAVAFALVVIIGLNVLVKILAPKLALSQAELLVIYTINSATFGLCGLGAMQFVPNLLAGPAYYSTAANGWNKWTYFIPAWARPDPHVVGAYYRGQSSFFTPAHIEGWIVPIIVWSGAVLTAFFLTYCVGTLLRKQWVEKEKLLFPIVIIPLEITRNGGDSPIWRNKLFWSGLTVAVVLESLAALHWSINPAIPYIPIKPSETVLDLSKYFNTPPWNGVGTLQLALYPLVIGLTYLLSLDVSFSCWFFYIFFKVESVLAVAFGFRDPGASTTSNRVPFVGEQSDGAFIGLAIMSVVFALPHLIQAFKTAFLKHDERTIDDSEEPLSYRTAYLGIAFSFLALCGFAMALGSSFITAAFFFLLFLVITIALARMRAEAGIAWCTGPQITPSLVNFGGSNQFTTQDMLSLSMIQVFGSDARATTMAPQMEAMKIAQASALHPRKLTAAIFAGAVLVVAASWVSILGIYYHYGAASAIVDPWRSSWGLNPYSTLQAWIKTPKPADYPGLFAVAFGTLFTIALSVLRTRFVWWPFHPIGYAFGGSGTDWMWFPVFIGWLGKALSIKFGGIKTFRNFLPFFIGLVIGDIVISALWAIGYLATGIHGYRTFPI